MRNARAKVVVLAGLLLTATACLAAAGAGLGAGIYLSDKGAGSLVTQPVERVYSATQQAFTDLQITQTRTSSDSAGTELERKVEGTLGDRDISVTLKSEGDDTRVEVVASTSAVTWDKDLAAKVLKQIVERSGD